MFKFKALVSLFGKLKSMYDMYSFVKESIPYIKAEEPIFNIGDVGYEIELIEKLEGFRAKAYKDTKNITTVGFGFNMQTLISRDIWESLEIEESFYDVYWGKAELSRDSAFSLFLDIWLSSEKAAIARARVLGLDFHSFPDWKKFILTDIAYNTGSVSGWTNVFKADEPHEVLFEARRKQHSIDSRVAKIGYHFNLIEDFDGDGDIDIDDARFIGLSKAKYLK